MNYDLDSIFNLELDLRCQIGSSLSNEASSSQNLVSTIQQIKIKSRTPGYKSIWSRREYQGGGLISLTPRRRHDPTCFEVVAGHRPPLSAAQSGARLDSSSLASMPRHLPCSRARPCRRLATKPRRKQGRERARRKMLELVHVCPVG